MSEARALAATERIRGLVANPEAQGLPRRGGLEPLDVSVKFNRAASHTSSAFQVTVGMKLAMGGENGAGNPVGPFRFQSALVAQGRTEAECLESFFNWMADETAVARFVEVVKAHEVDRLAKEALDAKAKDEAAAVARAKGFNETWVDRKTDQLARKFGLKDRKIQR